MPEATIYSLAQDIGRLNGKVADLTSNIATLTERLERLESHTHEIRSKTENPDIVSVIKVPPPILTQIATDLPLPSEKSK